MTTDVKASHKQGRGITHRKPLCFSRQAEACRSPRSHPSPTGLQGPQKPPKPRGPAGALEATQAPRARLNSSCPVAESQPGPGVAVWCPRSPQRPATLTQTPGGPLGSSRGWQGCAPTGWQRGRGGRLPTLLLPGPAPPDCSPIQTPGLSTFSFIERLGNTGIMVCHQSVPPESHTDVCA